MEKVGEKGRGTVRDAKEHPPRTGRLAIFRFVLATITTAAVLTVLAVSPAFAATYAALIMDAETGRVLKAVEPIRRINGVLTR